MPANESACKLPDSITPAEWKEKDKLLRDYSSSQYLHPKLSTLKTEPFICPVCDGCGLVDESLYTSLPTMERVTCKTCNGKGIVWSHQACTK